MPRSYAALGRLATLFALLFVAACGSAVTVTPRPLPVEVYERACTRAMLTTADLPPATERACRDLLSQPYAHTP